MKEARSQQAGNNWQPARIAVLGGSNPFTVGLIDALVDAISRLPPCQLVLHGRNVNNLKCVTEYAKYALDSYGWVVGCTHDLDGAIAGSRIVIHQIRYGGLEGRERDELIAVECECPADETLGPGALHGMLCTQSAVRSVAAKLRNTCPDAWVLNLTNPLSLVTAIMLETGVNRCLGLCELPFTTALKAAETLAIPFSELSWDYVGLNHRGFVVGLRYAGRDLIDKLANRLGSGTIGGVMGAEIAELGALPTKYFPIISGRHCPSAGRAAFVSSLREQIAKELFEDRETTPPSLRERGLEWYQMAVVPIIVGLLSAEPEKRVVNVLRDDGIVEERLAWVSAGQLQLTPVPAAGAKVTRWLSIYRAHEQALRECVQLPSLASIKRALDYDPAVPPTRVPRAAGIIWESYQRSARRSSQ